MRRLSWSLSAALLSALITSCGGGTSGQYQPPPPPPPPVPGFTVALSLSSLTLLQGGTTQTVGVSIAGTNGFSGSVSVTATGLPDGVTVSPLALSLSSGTSGTFSFAASSTAAIAPSSIIIEGISNTLKVDASLTLNVSGAVAPVPDPFHMIGGALVHGYYDESRELLFAANLGLNELEVISGADLSVRARVAVPQPVSIDQMADGDTLVIGTAAQEIVTVDENTMSVTRHPVPTLPGIYSALFYPTVVALANGKVFIIGQEQGVDSNNILDGGQYVIEWDSIKDAFMQVEPAPGYEGGWETDSLARSADHQWAAFAADQFYLYSSSTDSFTTAPLTTVNPNAQYANIAGYSLNSDASKIAVVSTAQATFLDRSFNVLGVTAIPGAFQDARTTVKFSPDDSRLLLQYDMPLLIEVLDVSSYTVLGYYPGYTSDDDNLERLLAVDSAGRAHAGLGPGLLEIDMTGPPIANPPAEIFCPLPGPSLTAPLMTAPLNTTEVLTLPFAIPSGTSYYVGGQPAPLVAGRTQIQIPPSSVVGPVEIECIGANVTFVNGWGFSYGVDPIGVSASLLPPAGNPWVYLYGFGFYSGPFAFSSSASITIGNQTASNVELLRGAPGSLQAARAQVPNGNPGIADLAITSDIGSGSLASAVTYVPSATVVAAPGLLQLLYDPLRNLLYVLKTTEVDVFNPSTLQWLSPFQIPGAGTSASYNVMALSPDGSRLVVVSPNGYAAVIDPDSPSQISVLTITANLSSSAGSVAITKYNKAVIAVSPNLEIDLSTLSVKAINIGMDFVRASTDGDFLYGFGPSGIYSIDPLTYSLHSTPSFGMPFWTDLTVSPDGSQLATIGGGGGAAGDIVGFFSPGLNLMNTNVYPAVSQPDDSLVLGSTFSPRGHVLVVPLGDSVEFWDADTGTLRGRLMTPEELQYLVYPVGPTAPRFALDTMGQTIFAISISGLTVIHLPQPIDDLPAQSWPLAHPVGNQAPVPYGVSARAIAMHKKSMARHPKQ
jgi:WD40 repeat protein